MGLSISASQMSTSQSLDSKQRDEGVGFEDTTTLEHLVAQQRNAVADAKRSRGHDMRRRSSSSQNNQVVPTLGNQLDAVGDWRTLRPPAGPSAAGRQFAWGQQKSDSLHPEGKGDFGLEQPNSSDSNSDEGASSSSGKKSNADAKITNFTEMNIQPASASAALAELTARLDFFKERRSQLMEQLRTLDPTLVPPYLNGHDLMPASPPLNSP